MRINKAVEESLPKGKRLFYTSTLHGKHTIPSPNDLIDMVMFADTPLEALRTLGSPEHPVGSTITIGEFIFVIDDTVLLPRSVLEDEAAFEATCSLKVYCVAVDENTGETLINFNVTSRSGVNSWLSKLTKQGRKLKAYCFRTIYNCIWAGEDIHYGPCAITSLPDDEALFLETDKSRMSFGNDLYVTTQQLGYSEMTVGLPEPFSGYYNTATLTRNKVQCPLFVLTNKNVVPVEDVYTKSLCQLLVEYGDLALFKEDKTLHFIEKQDVFQQNKYHSFSVGSYNLALTRVDTTNQLQGLAMVSFQSNAYDGIENYAVKDLRAYYYYALKDHIYEVPVTSETCAEEAFNYIKDRIPVPTHVDLFIVNSYRKEPLSQFNLSGAKTTNTGILCHYCGERFFMMVESFHPIMVRAVVERLQLAGASDIEIMYSGLTTKSHIFSHGPCETVSTLTLEQLNDVLTYMYKWFTEGPDSIYEPIADISSDSFKAIFMMLATAKGTNDKRNCFTKCFKFDFPANLTYTWGATGISCSNMTSPGSPTEYAQSAVRGETLFNALPCSARVSIVSASILSFALPTGDTSSLVPRTSSSYSPYYQSAIDEAASSVQSLEQYCRLVYGSNHPVILPGSKVNVITDTSPVEYCIHYLET